MEKNNTVGKAQGANPTLKEVENWLRTDLSRAISCLNAIHSDPDLLRATATFMLGRFTNIQNKPQVMDQQMDEIAHSLKDHK